jgi:hypothetical protein
VDEPELPEGVKRGGSRIVEACAAQKLAPGIGDLGDSPGARAGTSFRVLEPSETCSVAEAQAVKRFRFGGRAPSVSVLPMQLAGSALQTRRQSYAPTLVASLSAEPDDRFRGRATTCRPNRRSIAEVAAVLLSLADGHIAADGARPAMRGTAGRSQPLPRDAQRSWVVAECPASGMVD